MPKEDTQFKPGQSGNPGGRAKGSISLTRILRETLAAGDGDEAKKLVAAAIKNAIEGNPGQLKEIWARVDGSVTEKVEVTNVSLTESERLERINSLLERGRTRRTGLAADDRPN